MIEIREFVKQERGNSNYDPPLTVFQVEQLLIKYGRLIIDECARIVNDVETHEIEGAILDLKTKVR